ncbi:MAG TPA: 50S ribosomal protein L16, partial [bacterium]|nr:50S ribosomal protein L16 [bacterium]
MLMPKKVKFRRSMRGNNKGLAVRGSTISFGEYALKADDRCLITSRQ